MRPSLRNILESQLREYDTIESEAHAIAALRGWELSEADPMKRLLSNIKTKYTLSRGNPDTKIANMVIGRSRKEIIIGLQHHQNFGNRDLHISILSQKLLDCESATILQMERFL